MVEACMLEESLAQCLKDLETYDLKRLPAKMYRPLGNGAAGKSHLLCGIGQELIFQGPQVLFAVCNLAVQELQRVGNDDALMIDNIGYVQHNGEQMQVLFILLSESYERGPVMITSNLRFSKWERILNDAVSTAAAIDCLVYHSMFLELNVLSYGLEQSENCKKTANSTYN